MLILSKSPYIRPKAFISYTWARRARARRTWGTYPCNSCWFRKNYHILGNFCEFFLWIVDYTALLHAWLHALLFICWHLHLGFPGSYWAAQCCVSFLFPLRQCSVFRQSSDRRRIPASTKHNHFSHQMYLILRTTFCFNLDHLNLSRLKCFEDFHTM